MADSKKHIQAPWKYRPNEHDDWGRVVGSDGLTICYARVSRFTPEEQQSHREKGTDPVEGIARLIAAAPDLLEALESLLDAYSKPDERLCCDGRECGCRGSTVYQMAEHYARAAISRAEGRS